MNDDKGFYHCFGCSAHGDAIRWLTDHEGVPYPEAVERLASAVGMQVPQQTAQQQQAVRRAKSLQEVMEAAARWYEQQLQSPGGRVAKAYLRERGLTSATCQTFRIGFAPEGRDGLKKFLAGEGIAEQTMADLGLVIRPDRGDSYDRFRARLMFPITDRRGQVIAFGGRILPALQMQGGREAPKYLNSPETPLFHKGQVLYNYLRSRQPAHKAGTVLVTEGYMDVIALHQAGFENAVAPLGTAVTADHLRLLWQLADEPVMCLDGDTAGQRAMYRAAEVSLPLLKPGKSLKFLMLPKGEDPDTLVRSQGAEALTALLDQSLPLSEALWQRDGGNIDRQSPEKRAAVEHGLMQLCEQIADQTVRSHFRSFFRKKLWPERVKHKGGSPVTAARSSDVEAFMKEGEKQISRRREMELLELLLQYPALLESGDVEEGLGMFAFTDPACDAIRQHIMGAWVEEGAVEHAALTERTMPEPPPTRQLLARLLGMVQARAQEVPDDAYFRQQWQLLSSQHHLLAMQAECRQLEVELAEAMDEARYNHLVELKKSISHLQSETSRLQQNATAAAS